MCNLKVLFFLIVIASSCGLSHSEAFAQILARHQGETDPTNEGWQLAHFTSCTLVNGLPPNPEVEVGPAKDGNAWSIHDTTVNGTVSSTGGYWTELSPQEAKNAQVLGFRLSARVKVLDGTNPPLGALDVEFKKGGNRWVMLFGYDSESTTPGPVIRLLTSTDPDLVGPVFPVMDPKVYHQYDLVYDPAAMTATLYIDGEMTYSGYAGSQTDCSDTSYVYWGSGHADDSGLGWFSLIELSLRRPFTRGDANADGKLDVSDPIFILNYLFASSSGSEPTCFEALDVNDDGVLGVNPINIADPIYLLNFLFGGGPPPPAPYPECGVDANPSLGCESFPPCG